MLSGIVRAFDQPTLGCVGTLDGAPCPHAIAVDLAASDAAAQLSAEGRARAHAARQPRVENIPRARHLRAGLMEEGW